MAPTTTAYEIPRAEPVIIAIANEDSRSPVNNAEDKDDCGCVPPNASKQVHAVGLCPHVDVGGKQWPFRISNDQSMHAYSPVNGL